MNTAYGLKTRTRLEPAEAEIRVREHLTTEGFGILTEIDVAATLKEKLGVTRSSYRILGACNPQLANDALEVESDVGLLLPCNVVIYKDGNETVVAALDPATMVSLTDNPAMAVVADDARSRLGRVIEAISKEGANV